MTKPIIHHELVTQGARGSFLVRTRDGWKIANALWRPR
jgi:hypothetical protein